MTAVAELITDAFEEFDLDNTPFVVSSATTKITSNEWVTTTEEIEVGGTRHPFQTRYRFVNPRLSSISLRQTDASTISGRIDFNAVVVAHRNLEVQYEGQWVPVSKLCLAALRKGNPDLKASDEQLLGFFQNYGFAQDEEMPMYLQHLGASADEYKVIAERFCDLGAKENTDSVRSARRKVNILSSYRHPGAGMPIADLEISYADRTAAKVNPNAGFIGFLDATWNTFSEIVHINGVRTKIRKHLEENPDDAEVRAEDAKIRQMFSSASARRPFHNWGGTSRVAEMAMDDDDNELGLGAVRYYAQQVPCGRFSVSVDGKAETWNVWRTANADGPQEAQPIDSNDLMNAFGDSTKVL